MKKLISVAIIVIAFTACANPKEKIVEELKVATRELKAANDRIEQIKDQDKINIQLGRSTNMDSFVTWMREAYSRKNQWEPIVDSLEMELKKY